MVDGSMAASSVEGEGIISKRVQKLLGDSSPRDPVILIEDSLSLSTSLSDIKSIYCMLNLPALPIIFVLCCIGNRTLSS